jgi:hypothetical protein
MHKMTNTFVRQPTRIIKPLHCSGPSLNSSSTGQKILCSYGKRSFTTTLTGAGCCRHGQLWTNLIYEECWFWDTEPCSPAEFYRYLLCGRCLWNVGDFYRTIRRNIPEGTLHRQCCTNLKSSIIQSGVHLKDLFSLHLFQMSPYVYFCATGGGLILTKMLYIFLFTRCKSPCIEQIKTKFIQAGGETLLSEVLELWNCILNKEELPQ